MSDYYAAHELMGMDEVREIVPTCDELNWLFVGTSGVHGSYFTLDGFDIPQNDGWTPENLTILIVQPRMVRTFYGHLPVDADDIPWLRERVAETVGAVATQAEGNLPRVTT